MFRKPTTTTNRPASRRTGHRLLGSAAALALLAGSATALAADPKVEDTKVSDDKRCLTITMSRGDIDDTPVRDLHFGKGSLPADYEGLEVTVTHVTPDGEREEQDGWVVDVQNGKVNVYAPDDEMPAGGTVEFKITLPEAAEGETQHKWGRKKSKLYSTQDGDHLTSNDVTNDTLTKYNKDARLAATVASIAPTRPGDLLLSPAEDAFEIEPFASVACTYDGDPQTTTPTSWWRSFHLADLGVGGAFVATEVIVPIELAFHPEGSQAFTVRLYHDPTGGDPIPDELELLGAAGLDVDNTELTTVSVPLAGRVPAGGTLVMEVESDDGSAPAEPGTLLGSVFFIGGNTLGQASPSYFSAPACEIFEPVDMATLGFELSLGMSVVGYEEAGCYADLDGDGSLTIFDFLTFQNLFVAGDAQADCDGSGSLTIFDFLCFQNEFVAGCPGQAVTVDGVRPGEVRPGAELTIVGSGFGDVPENLRVMLGADEAGHGGVAAQVLRASPGELIVRVPDVVSAVSGESVVVSVGETIDPPPFESDLFETMMLDAFAIDGQGMIADALAVVLEDVVVSVQSTQVGGNFRWAVCGNAAKGESQKVSITVEHPAGKRTTYSRMGNYADDTTPEAAAVDLSAWLGALPGVLSGVFVDKDGKWHVTVTTRTLVSSMTVTTTGGTHTIK